VRRFALSFLVLACLVPVAAAGGAAPRVQANLKDCHSSQRFAVFEGVMRGKATMRMEMRFDIQRAEPGGAFERVKAEGLSVWNRAAAGVVRYTYRKRIDSMTGPATYRAHVRFRWRGSSGKVVRRADALTPECEQPA
jgi:hypothetical protein